MKNVRILIVVALIAVLVILAQGGVGAWTARLQADPVAVAPAPVLGARPQGTVVGNSAVPVGTACTTLVATFCLTSTQAGLSAQAITVPPAGVTAPTGVDPTRMVLITGTDTKTTAAINYTNTPALAAGEKVAYWDGTKWVDASGSIAAGAPLPLVLAVIK